MFPQPPTDPTCSVPHPGSQLSHQLFCLAPSSALFSHIHIQSFQAPLNVSIVIILLVHVTTTCFPASALDIFRLLSLSPPMVPPQSSPDTRGLWGSSYTSGTFSLRAFALPVASASQALSLNTYLMVNSLISFRFLLKSHFLNKVKTQARVPKISNCISTLQQVLTWSYHGMSKICV